MRPTPAIPPSWALAAALASCTAAAQADGAPQWDLRMQGHANTVSQQGPGATANALLPGLVAPTPDTLLAEAEMRHTLRLGQGSRRVAVGVNALARHGHAAGGASRTQGRLNELHAGVDAGSWSLTAGKRVLGWDVGYGFRPNDLVQQEARRTLTSATPEGRPLLMAETFGTDTAASLVWVNPHHLHSALDRTQGAQESALAARAYWRQGAADWHAFARAGRRTGASLGAALAWVATDELELHASARTLRRHDAWSNGLQSSGALAMANPWTYGEHGATTQWLLGLSWTGAEQQGVLLEVWHDGTALSNSAWRAWGLRNATLSAPSPAPAAARAGNLAWQMTPFDHANLRQDSVFLRLSYQPGAWQFTFDTLFHPADRGLVTTAGLSYQGDRWKLGATLRHLGGAAQALAAQLPQRRQVALTAQWTH